MKIGIIVGHTKRSQGAYSKTLGQSEYQYNSGLAETIKNLAETLGDQVKIELRNDGGISGAFKRILAWRPDCVIELHFNAANGKASGAETLFSDNYDKAGVRELALAQLTARAMADALGIPSRGVKERTSKGERGFFNLSQSTNVACVLIESGFGDNPVDAGRMKTRKAELARAIVDAARRWKATV